MAFQTAGYGGVYRPPPNIAQQQVRPPLMPVGPPPVAFTPLGQWRPGAMDAPDMTEQWAQFRLRLMPAGSPPVPFTIAPYPSAYFAPPWPQVALSQRLPVTPPDVIPGIAFPTPAAWLALHAAAFLRDWPIPLLTQRLATLGIGAGAVPFPPLGGWLPGTMDPPATSIQTAQRLLLLPVGDAPVPFPVPPRWFAPDVSPVPFAQRVPTTAAPLIIVGVPYPTPAQWYALHLAALLAPPFPFAVFQRPPQVPVSGEPVAFPFLGKWHPSTMAPPDLSVQLAQFRLALIPAGDGPVRFPPLGSWPPGSMTPLVWWAPYLVRVGGQVFAAVPGFGAYGVTDRTVTLYSLTDRTVAGYLLIDRTIP